MLNEYDMKRLWEHLIAAETRALYFGDLTSRYTKHKQIITGISFLLSSGAAATIIGKAPAWVPALLALAVAATTAYAMATNLDGRIRTMAKLHSSWTQIATLYQSLWSHAYDPDAAAQFQSVLDRELEPSELATTSAPNDEKLMWKWQQRVFELYHLQSPA